MLITTDMSVGGGEIRPCDEPGRSTAVIVSQNTTTSARHTADDHASTSTSSSSSSCSSRRGSDRSSSEEEEEMVEAMECDGDEQQEIDTSDRHIIHTTAVSNGAAVREGCTDRELCDNGDKPADLHERQSGKKNSTQQATSHTCDKSETEKIKAKDTNKPQKQPLPTSHKQAGDNKTESATSDNNSAADTPMFVPINEQLVISTTHTVIPLPTAKSGSPGKSNSTSAPPKSPSPPTRTITLTLSPSPRSSSRSSSPCLVNITTTTNSTTTAAATSPRHGNPTTSSAASSPRSQSPPVIGLQPPKSPSCTSRSSTPGVAVHHPADTADTNSCDSTTTTTNKLSTPTLHQPWRDGAASAPASPCRSPLPDHHQHDTTHTSPRHHRSQSHPPHHPSHHPSPPSHSPPPRIVMIVPDDDQSSSSTSSHGATATNKRSRSLGDEEGGDAGAPTSKKSKVFHFRGDLHKGGRSTMDFIKWITRIQSFVKQCEDLKKLNAVAQAAAAAAAASTASAPPTTGGGVTATLPPPNTADHTGGSGGANATSQYIVSRTPLHTSPKSDTVREMLDNRNKVSSHNNHNPHPPQQKPAASALPAPHRRPGPASVMASRAAAAAAAAAATATAAATAAATPTASASDQAAGGFIDLTDDDDIRPFVPSHPAPLPKPPASFAFAHKNGKLPPPKPLLKPSRVANGIVLSWNMDLTQQHETIKAYQLYAYQQTSAAPVASLWKKVGDVKALALPMACTLTQFQDGNKYHFAVRAVDIHDRVGLFSDPGSIQLNKL